MREEVPDQVGDGVGFAGAGRSLHYNGGMALDFSGNVQLLAVGELCQKYVGILAANIGQTLFQGRLGGLRLRPLMLDANEMEEVGRNLFGVFEGFSDPFRKGADAVGLSSQQEHGRGVAHQGTVGPFHGTGAFFEQNCARGAAVKEPGPDLFCAGGVEWVERGVRHLRLVPTYLTEVKAADSSEVGAVNAGGFGGVADNHGIRGIVVFDGHALHEDGVVCGGAAGRGDDIRCQEFERLDVPLELAAHVHELVEQGLG